MSVEATFPVFQGRAGRFRKKILLSLLQRPKTVQQLVKEFGSEYSWGAIKHHLNILRSHSMIRIFTLYSRQVPFYNPVPFSIRTTNPHTLYAPSFRSLWEHDVLEQAYRIHGEERILQWFIEMLRGYKISIAPSHKREIRAIFQILTESNFEFLDELRDTIRGTSTASDTVSFLYRAIYLTDWALVLLFIGFSYLLYTQKLQTLMKRYGFELDPRAEELLRNVEAIVSDPQTKFLDVPLRELLRSPLLRQVMDTGLSSVMKKWKS